MRGVPFRMVLLFCMGSEECNRISEDCRTFPISVPVASQMPIAVGYAMAMKLKKEKGAVVVYFSDGATSEGDFNEALNFATVFNTPNVFICQNNQWAISTPREKQSASKTLSQKAIAYEMETLQVDGNDLFAVYEASQWALQRARNGDGPTFLEFVTYRREMHTTADDPTKYQDPEKHARWLKNDPIVRFENYLKSEKIIDESFKENISDEAEEILKKEFEEAEKLVKGMTIEDMFRYTYAEMPQELQEQLEELRKCLE
jgi:pyruvate dehydrogenase E1 component alpha subunit